MDIPGYKIIDTLGQGGMATVYLAIQESFEREVALKVMSPAMSADPSFSARFLREARIVSRLVHPNIVTVYDVGMHEGHHFLSMEYVPGRDLKHRRFELNLPQNLQVIKDIARALDYAGHKGYVHRDVKPENIMLRADDGRAVLMDFGIARPSDLSTSVTLTGTAIGTPYYMSPEQARGGLVDHRADLYSLGVVAFLLLSGRVPYDADSAVAVGIMHLTAEIPRLPKHLQVFQPLIDRAMAKDPAQRYQSGSELIADLRAIPSADIVLAMAACDRQLVVDDADSVSPTMLSPVPINTESRAQRSPVETASAADETELYIPDEQRVILSTEDRAGHQPEVLAKPDSGKFWGRVGLLLTAMAIATYVWYLALVVSPRQQPGTAPNDTRPIAASVDRESEPLTGERYGIPQNPEVVADEVGLPLDSLQAAEAQPDPVEAAAQAQPDPEPPVPALEPELFADILPPVEVEMAGGGVDPAPATPATPAVAEPQVMRLQVSAGELSEPTDLYREQPSTISVDRIIYLGFGYRHLPDETSVIQAILYEGDRSTQIAQVPVIVSGEAGVHFFRMERPVTGFPDGVYTVELQLGDAILASSLFSVKRYP